MIMSEVDWTRASLTLPANSTVPCAVIESCGVVPGVRIASWQINIQLHEDTLSGLRISRRTIQLCVAGLAPH